VLGAAYQTGALNVSASAIERAIEINGTAVPANLQAFRRGRQLVADPKALAAELSPAPAAPTHTAVDPATIRRVRSLVHAEHGGELARLLDVRVPDLIAYQDENYARQYAEFVEHVRARTGNTAVTEAVARNLYKLMAYKDEYEVARLSLDPTLETEIQARFGPGSRYAYQLHPPVMRALGLNRKIALGPSSRPLLRVLRAARRLRGTGLDLFGYAKVRRIERKLITEYREAVTQALNASRGNETVLLELAELPDMVRGYEEIKLANVATYRHRLAQLLETIDQANTGRASLPSG